MGLNATVDDDGIPHVTAIDGIDTRFKRDGSNGDVYVMTCPGYYKLDSTSTHNEFLYSDTQYDATRHCPACCCPTAANGHACCSRNTPASLRLPATPPVRQRQGDRPRIRLPEPSPSIRAQKGQGYAGRCAGDTFYVQLMLMLKYATKNSDVLGGCWQYTQQTAVTKAETGVKRVIIATSAANNFDVGSTVNVAPTRNATTPTTTAPPGHAPS